MSVGLLLVTHGKIGDLLLETMTDMLGELPLAVEVLEVRRVRATGALLRRGRRMVQRLDAGDGVLVLTDAHGATPGNIANQLSASMQTRVVAGVNLPMLVRVFNYSCKPLDELAQIAVEGGQKGITLCPKT